MNHMFYNCSSLNTISLVYYDTQKVENMNSLFAYCSSSTEIIFGSFSNIVYSVNDIT